MVKQLLVLVLMSCLLAGSAVLLMFQTAGGSLTRFRQEEPFPAIQDPDQPPPEKAEPPRQDTLGDPLPPGALARMGTARLREWSSSGRSAIFSPDGKLLVSSDGETARLWSTTTGKLAARIRLESGFGQPAFWPDGKSLALPSGKVITLWDPNTGRKLGDFPAKGSLPYVASVLAFSADGKILAVGSHKGEVTLWNTVTAAQVAVLDSKPAASNGIYHLRLTPDGRTLVYMGRDQEFKECIWHWDLATRTMLKQVEMPRRGGTVQLSDDGQTLAGPAGGGIVHVWDATTGKERLVLQGELSRATYGVGFTHDGKMLATTWAEPGAEQATFSFWDAATGKVLRRFPIPRSAMYGIHFSPDGRLVVAQGQSPIVQIFDTATGKRLLDGEGHEDSITNLAFTPEGRSLVSSDHRTLRVWDAATGKPQKLMTDAPRQPPVDAQRGSWAGAVFALLLSGRVLLSGGTDGLLSLQELDSGKVLRRLILDGKPEQLRDRGRQVYRLALAADGRSVAAISNTGGPNSNAMIDVWDLESGRNLVHRPDPVQRSLTAFSPDAKTVLGHQQVFSAADVADPQAKAGTRKVEATQVVLEEVATGRTLLTIAQPDNVSSIRGFAPDGQTFLTTTFSVAGQPSQQRLDRSSLHLWELATGKERLRIAGTKSGYEFSYTTVAFAPGSRILATAREDKTIQLWDLATGRELLRRTGYDAPLDCLTFSPDGKTLASGHRDSTILVWDVARATERLHRPNRPAEPSELEQWWTDLAGGTATKAHTAIWGLVGVSDQALPLLRARLQPAVAEPAEQLRQLISDLDSNRFQVREAASRRLTGLEEQAEPMLRAALKTDPSTEKRRRIEALLAVPRVVHAPEALRGVRAVQVLEQIGSAAAKDLLAKLAMGAANMRLTQDANAASERLARRATAAP